MATTWAYSSGLRARRTSAATDTTSCGSVLASGSTLVLEEDLGALSIVSWKVLVSSKNLGLVLLLREPRPSLDPVGGLVPEEVER